MICRDWDRSNPRRNINIVAMYKNICENEAMENKILVTWLGKTDIDAASGKLKDQLGPIGQAVTERGYKRIYLLSDYDKAINDLYEKWLTGKTRANIQVLNIKLTSPVNFREIYESAIKSLDHVKKNQKAKPYKLTYHLSPGTSAMAAIWLILAKTNHPAELIESSLEHGVKTVSFPFELSAEYLFALKKETIDEEFEKAAEFKDILTQCPEMKSLIVQANRFAQFNRINILLLGESGTGKELFARAIHNASGRRKAEFVPINCGAIPPELLESELFGHERGAFTGAEKKEGLIKSADMGTLFLDEIGELPLNLQVKLLRVLQERTFRPIGSNKEFAVDFRIIAATNKNLYEEIAHGKFREDLFYRIGVGILQIPALRERDGDISFLIDELLKKINEEFKKADPEWTYKKFSSSAKIIMSNYEWPGNIRELWNTLVRACLSSQNTIREEDVKRAIFNYKVNIHVEEDIMNMRLGRNFKISELLDKITSHYLARAMAEAQGNKSKAARLLGLKNYQTLSNWLDKYGVK